MTDAVVKVGVRLSALGEGEVLPPEETAARLSLFAAMFDAYPRARNQDPETTIEAYLDLTADIPLGWLAQACKFLMMHPDTIFIPPLGRIRQRAAIEIIRTKRAKDGNDPDRSQIGTTSVQADKIDWWIAQGRRVEGLPAITPASSAVYIPAELEEAFARIGTGIIDDSDADAE